MRFFTVNLTGDIWTEAEKDASVKGGGVMGIGGGGGKRGLGWG